MYIFGSYIIETFSGKTFEDFVKERIFEPLNMTATTYSPQEADATGLLSQSWAYNGRRIPFIFDEPAAQLVAGTGGIISNAIDMVRLHFALCAVRFAHLDALQVCVNYKDLEYLKDECDDGRRLGFTGKVSGLCVSFFWKPCANLPQQAIHPSQVDIIQSTFVPSAKGE